MNNTGFILTSTTRHVSLVALVVLLVAGGAAAFLKLQYLGTTHSGDYDNYVMTARYLLGEQVDTSGISVAGRMLKPLYPALLSSLNIFMDFHSAALLQSTVFYLLFILAMFLLAKEFFDDVPSAVLAVLLTAFSYPVLKYGLDVYAETGAWFSYALSLWLTLLFTKRPSRGLFFANVAVITIGFLWKEYIIVAGIIFGLALLFHAMLSVRQKILYIGLYAGFFLTMHVPWQLHVFRMFDFSYLDWYLEAGADGFSYEFTLKNILKSTAALLGTMWLLVPLGLMKLQSTSAPQRFFVYISNLPPLIGYAWGFISSRLLYVIAPPMILIAILGMRNWSRKRQVVLVAVALMANIAWLILSYRITL